MKNTIVSALVLLSLGLAAQRAKMDAGEMAKKSAARMEKKLWLTVDQKNRWEEAVLIKFSSNRPLREKLKGPTTPAEREELKKKIRENNQKFQMSLESFLDERQVTELKRLRKEHRTHSGHHKRNVNG